MVGLSGGRGGAHGYQYQYLRTLEALLDAADGHAINEVRVEGPPAADEHPDTIDFDAVAPDGRVVLAAQVKSRSPGASMAASEAFGHLADLVAERGSDVYEADSYKLLTNAQPGPKTRDLQAVLAKLPTEAAQAVAAIGAVLHDAPARLARLKSLSSKELARLSRSTIEFDPRDTYELREQLRERMRVLRQQTVPGLGWKTAGLLTRVLIADILSKAASSDGTVCVADFRQQILSNDTALAVLNGYRDWGAIVGPMPPIADIARPVLLEAVGSAIGRINSDRRVLRAVLTGPSGIGKSSLAAAWVADRADSYDWIFWIDAENENSTRLGLRQAIHALSGMTLQESAPLSLTELQNVVRDELTRSPLRWLLVIDNAGSGRASEPFLPATGNGNVLLTSLDASANWSSAQVVPVGPMQPDEAEALLAARLHIPSPDASQRRSLRTLADRMERWPLALALATGYMNTCGITLDAVDSYVELLSNRAVADEQAIPPGYPRTLTAAITMCLDALHQRSTKDHIYDLALGMIVYAAYVGSRQIPVHLVAAAVGLGVLDENEPGVGDGPVVLDPDQVIPAEAVRELRHFSLVAIDAPLPTTHEDLLPDADHAIAVNTIVQQIVRAFWDSGNGGDLALRAMACHTARWLLSSFNLGFVHRAAVLAGHAEILAGHIIKRGIAHPDVALLFGNLAAAHHLSGNLPRAVHLLRQELALLKERPDDIKVVQAQLVLAGFFLTEEAGSLIEEKQAVVWLESVLLHCRRLADDHPNAASKLLTQCLFYLRRSRHIREQDFQRLEAAYADLNSRIPVGPFALALELLANADKMITDGDSAGAEHAARQALAHDSLAENKMEAQRLLLEALIDQQKFEQARELFDEIRQRFGSASMFHPVIAHLVQNAGLMCALLRHFGHMEAGDLLVQIVHWPAARQAASFQTVGWQTRFQILIATASWHEGDREMFAKEYAGINLQQLDDQGFEAWAMLAGNLASK